MIVVGTYNRMNYTMHYLYMLYFSYAYILTVLIDEYSAPYPVSSSTSQQDQMNSNARKEFLIYLRGVKRITNSSFLSKRPEGSDLPLSKCTLFLYLLSRARREHWYNRHFYIFIRHIIEYRISNCL